MCDPVTLLVVAGTAMVAGAGVGMYSSIQQGKFQKDMMNYQAGLERERAELAKQNAEIQSVRLGERRRMEAAAGMTQFAASGMLIDDAPASAPNIWEQDMAAETAWQQEAIRTNAMYEAWGYNANASMLVAQGSAARTGATLDAWGTGLSGAGSALVMGAAAAGQAKPGAPAARADQYAGAAGTHGGSSVLAYA